MNLPGVEINPVSVGDLGRFFRKARRDPLIEKALGIEVRHAPRHLGGRVDAEDELADIRDVEDRVSGSPVLHRRLHALEGLARRGHLGEVRAGADQRVVVVDAVAVFGAARGGVKVFLPFPTGRVVGEDHHRFRRNREQVLLVQHRALGPERGREVARFRGRDFVENLYLRGHRLGDEAPAVGVGLRRVGIRHPHGAVGDAAQTELPDHVGMFGPLGGVGAPDFAHLGRMAEIGILQIAPALFPVIEIGERADAHRFDVVLREKHATPGALLHERGLRRIHDVHKTGRDNQIEPAAHQGLGDVAHDLARHHLAVIRIVDVSLSAAAFPLGEQVLVVDKPAAEFEGWFAGDEFHFVPGQARARARRARGPEMKRVHFEIFFDERIQAKHRAALVAAGDDEPVADGLDPVGFPLAPEIGAEARGDFFQPCGGLGAVQRDEDDGRAGGGGRGLGKPESAAGDFPHIARKIGGGEAHALGLAGSKDDRGRAARPGEFEGGAQRRDGRQEKHRKNQAR